MAVAQEESCVFCQIINKISPANIIYEDDTMVVFTDIRPASKHHYLVVPKKHLRNAKELCKDDLGLLQDLISKGHSLADNGNDDLESVRFGFHWPPFQSINHLHLHVIFPTNDMNFISRWIFKPNSFWFVSPEYVLERVSKL